MIVEYIRYEVPSASRDTIVEAYRSAGQELAASAQCMRYEIAQGVEEPGHFTVRIEWRSLEEHEKGFRGGAQFPAFFAKVKPFFDQIREMKHYRVVAGGPGGSAP
jgi:quinol monooxygenase YgiN